MSRMFSAFLLNNRSVNSVNDPTISVAGDGVHRVGGGVSRGQRTLAYRYMYTRAQFDQTRSSNIHARQRDTDDIYESNSRISNESKLSETWNQHGETLYLG